MVAIWGFIIAAGVILPPALLPRQDVITAYMGLFAYGNMHFAVGPITFGWSPYAFRHQLKELIRFSDDLWLTGIKGKDVARAIIANKVSRWDRRLSLMIGILNAVLGAWILVDPTFPVEILIAAYLLWFSGAALSDFFIRGEIPPMLTLWIDGFAISTINELWRKGANAPFSVFPGRAIRLFLRWIPLAVSMMFMGFLPPYAIIWLTPKGQSINRLPWSPFMIMLTISFFPLSFLSSSLYCLLARRRAPAIIAGMPRRFDEILELRRVRNHETRKTGRA